MKMDSKVRALIWEEFRVGGAIAGVSLVAGLLILFSFWLNQGAAFFHHDLDFYILIELAAPLLVSLLLILNPDYSGVLGGGYSRRVLRLPVPTSVAVGVSLCARTLFVLVVTLASVTVAAFLMDIPVRFEFVLVVPML